jgi:hypothetical protein
MGGIAGENSRPKRIGSATKLRRGAAFQRWAGDQTPASPECADAAIPEPRIGQASTRSESGT